MARVCGTHSIPLLSLLLFRLLHHRNTSARRRQVNSVYRRRPSPVYVTVWATVNIARKTSKCNYSVIQKSPWEFPDFSAPRWKHPVGVSWILMVSLHGYNKIAIRYFLYSVGSTVTPGTWGLIVYLWDPMFRLLRFIGIPWIMMVSHWAIPMRWENLGMSIGK